MSQRIIVLEEAEDELIEAQRWYEAQRAGLGQEFAAAIDEAMKRLLNAPRAASPILSVPPSIGARQVLAKPVQPPHPPRQVGLRGFEKKMIMIPEQAVGVANPSLLKDLQSQKF